MEAPRREALRQVLEAYHPTDPAERAHLARMLALCASVGAMGRAHTVPGHFTASAFVLSAEGDRLLLIEHLKLGRWLQPGGHIEDADEGVFEAAHREVSEEVGLVGLRQSPGVFDVDVHRIPARKGEPSHEHFDVRVLLHASSDVFRAGEEVGGARWVALCELEALTDDASVLRAARKILARREHGA